MPRPLDNIERSIEDIAGIVEHLYSEINHIDPTHFKEFERLMFEKDDLENKIESLKQEIESLIKGQS